MFGESLAEKNPFTGLTIPKKEKLLPKYMTIEDVEKLINAVTSYWHSAEAKGLTKKSDDAFFAKLRDLAIIEVIYSGGLRINEALSLNFADLDLLSEFAKIKGKGKKERLSALGRPAVAALNNYLNQARPLRTANDRTTAPIFVNKHGTRLSARSFQRNSKNI